MSAEAFQNIKENIELIPDEKKADEALYCLINGMCSKCGCFVEMRAAYAVSRCPHENKLW